MRPYCIASVMAAAIISSGCIVQAEEMESVYSPKHGVICDNNQNFCVDKNGISKNLTRTYFGEEDAQNINKHAKPRKQFSLSNGVTCSAEHKQCYTDHRKNTIDHWATRILYGNNSTQEESAKHSPPVDDNVFFPTKGVVCDKISHFCADSDGISMSLTQAIMGSTKPLEKIIGNADDVNLSIFTLSNGIFCDSTEKKCYTDRFRTHKDKNFTHYLY